MLCALRFLLAGNITLSPAILRGKLYRTRSIIILVPELMELFTKYGNGTYLSTPRNCAAVLLRRSNRIGGIFLNFVEKREKRDEAHTDNDCVVPASSTA